MLTYCVCPVFGLRSFDIAAFDGQFPERQTILLDVSTFGSPIDTFSYRMNPFDSRSELFLLEKDLSVSYSRFVEDISDT